MQKVASDIPPTPESAEPIADPNQIGSYAQNCASYVGKSLGIPLDFSVDTLPLLDHYLADARQNAAHRPDTLQMLAVVAGSYVGQIVARRHHGIWNTNDKDPLAWSIELLQGDLLVYPIAVCWLALQAEQPVPPLAVFEVAKKWRDQITTHLDQLPSVREEEFIAPSTRIEVVDIIADLVVSLRHEHSDSPPEKRNPENN